MDPIHLLSTGARSAPRTLSRHWICVLLCLGLAGLVFGQTGGPWALQRCRDLRRMLVKCARAVFMLGIVWVPTWLSRETDSSSRMLCHAV